MRTFDPSVHNYIANHPDVFEKIGGNRDDLAATQGYMLFGGAAAWPDRWWLLHNETRDGAMLFERHSPGVFELHTMFLPSCRGRKAIRDGIAMLAEMFVDHGADRIWGMTPSSNKASRAYHRLVGGTHIGFAENDKLGQCEVFDAYKEPWIARYWSDPE